MKRLIAVAVGCLLVLGYAAYAQVSSSQSRGHSEPAQTKTADEVATMSAGETAKHMEMMNKMMVKALDGGDAQYDARFIDMMIPHHEGAVMMARDALKHARHQELKDMAAKMIKDQQMEIEHMRKLRQEWYGGAADSSRAE